MTNCLEPFMQVTRVNLMYALSLKLQITKILPSVYQDMNGSVHSFIHYRTIFGELNAELVIVLNRGHTNPYQYL